MKELAYAIAIVAWVFGIAVSEALHAFFAYIFPPYAWLLLAEWLLTLLEVCS